jgi:hypothetical protein
MKKQNITSIPIWIIVIATLIFSCKKDDNQSLNQEKTLNSHTTLKTNLW